LVADVAKKLGSLKVNLSEVQTGSASIAGTCRNVVYIIVTYAISYGFFGPLEESNGKRFILVIIDAATVWPELIATDHL
jgi:hypothetical protein